MDLGLNGRVAVVTGGTSGIGLACVDVLLQEGADVALCGRDEARLAKVAAGFAERYGAARILAKVCDVTKTGEVEAFAPWAQPYMQCPRLAHLARPS